MSETQFYDICDAAEEINENITNDYFPTKEDIDANINAFGIESQVDMLAYFASNPFKRMNRENATDPDYLATVGYCKKKLSEVPLSDDESVIEQEEKEEE